MIRLAKTLAAAFVAALVFSPSTLAAPKHGIAMHGEPALPPDFKHLPYANPDAPQGGTLRQAVTGSFDSVNPFIVKGQKATGVGTYVYESLMARNWAEPFSLYGHIAESIDVSEDRQSFTFKLRPQAKFSDGVPITSADIVFSLETLRKKGLPRYRTLYSSVASVEAPDDHTIVFKQTEGNRELPLLIGLMPVLPKHFWEKRQFDQTVLEPILGSGPYVLKTVNAGETIVYQKNPDWWAKDLPNGKGLWNFDEVRFDYYRDSNGAFEAFKKGLVDVRIEPDPVRWSSGYDFPAVTEKKVILEKIAQRSPAPTSGFAFNTRRKLFEDRRVREALLYAFDFEWANANLFSNLYQRTFGFFSGSELSSKGLPASEAEKALLAEAVKRIDPAILDGTYSLPTTDGSGRNRKVLRKSVELLEQSGWKIGENGLVNAAGEPFSFMLTVINKEQEKIALHYQRSLKQIGIDMQIRTVDSSQFTRMTSEFDYDMIPVTWFNSLSPGNEQLNCCTSQSKDTPGSRNFWGIADPDIDRVIDALIKAQTRDDLVTSARALDRLLVNGVYMIPFYDAGGQWVARWSYIGRPDEQPLPGFETISLWRNP